MKFFEAPASVRERRNVMIGTGPWSSTDFDPPPVRDVGQP